MVQPRRGQVVLVVLWKLLQLVLVVREVRVHTEIPGEHTSEGAPNQHQQPFEVAKPDRQR